MNQRNIANIGGPIFLAVLGAILYFALTDTYVAGISLTTVGIILIAAGAIWLVLGLILGRPRETVTQERVDRIDSAGAHDGVTEREVRHQG